jgi:uncharacterized protein YgiM (DUF1202 family)
VGINYKEDGIVVNKKETPKTEVSKEEEKKYAALIGCKSLNLRKTPTKDGDVVKIITGTDSIVVERKADNGWYKVKVDKTSGFVMDKFIEVI